jgi:hypothetical protein
MHVKLERDREFLVIGNWQIQRTVLHMFYGGIVITLIFSSRFYPSRRFKQGVQGAYVWIALMCHTVERQSRTKSNVQQDLRLNLSSIGCEYFGVVDVSNSCVLNSDISLSKLKRHGDGHT